MQSPLCLNVTGTLVITFPKKDTWHEMERPSGSDCGTKDYNGAA